MKLFILLFLLFSTALFAEEDAAKTMANSVNASVNDFKINKDDIRASLENLRKTGKISQADYLNALKELQDMDNNKVEDIKKKALDTINKNPEKALEMTK
jgi:competence protein ComGC